MAKAKANVEVLDRPKPPLKSLKDLSKTGEEMRRKQELAFLGDRIDRLGALNNYLGEYEEAFRERDRIKKEVAEMMANGDLFEASGKTFEATRSTESYRGLDQKALKKDFGLAVIEPYYKTGIKNFIETKFKKRK